MTLQRIDPAPHENRDAVRASRYFACYNWLTAPLLPAVAAYTLWRRYCRRKSAASWRGQWGHVPAEALRALNENGGDIGGPRIWLHAVSVGEQVAARPVLRSLRQAMPGARIALSVTTDTGYQTARATLAAHEADALFYFPLDTPWALRRTLRAVRPTHFLTMETELWPNVLHLAKDAGARTFLVNGRVSDNLLRRAPRMGWIWRWMLLNLDGLLMRSESDAERIAGLGAPAAKIVVTGDVKLDAVPPGDDGSQLRRHWRTSLGIGQHAPLLVAGSTHPGEELALLEAYRILHREFAELRLVVAPRHIERAAEVAGLLSEGEQGVVLRSQLANEPAGARPIIVLDSVGELAQLYAAADAAYVGGSLVERGGHNLLEPVMRGVGVAYGPHIANFREAAQLVQSAAVGCCVANPAELAEAIGNWLRDPQLRAALAQRAAAALAPHRGAASRAAQLVAKWSEV